MHCPHRLLPLFLLPPLLTGGCVAAGAIGSAIGAAFSGLAYMSDGEVERTFVGTLPEVWRAGVTVFRLMDLTVSEGTRDENTGELTGTASDLTVILTMSTVTARTTRVTIEAIEGTIGRDHATASEVLHQIALHLSPSPSAPPPLQSR
ncbi:MAG: DUF3568 family protein [candidate division NC10 bacterium]|nr:DUF3568 family protein [candidate division NC10 bacterium]MBI4390838.1 DUF3568 family protein [candidate division NC10 bacterium]